MQVPCGPPDDLTWLTLTPEQWWRVEKKQRWSIEFSPRGYAERRPFKEGSTLPDASEFGPRPMRFSRHMVARWIRQEELGAVEHNDLKLRLAHLKTWRLGTPELGFLNGREKLAGYDLVSLIHY